MGGGIQFSNNYTTRGDMGNVSSTLFGGDFTVVLSIFGTFSQFNLDNGSSFAQGAIVSKEATYGSTFQVVIGQDGFTPLTIQVDASTPANSQYNGASLFSTTPITQRVIATRNGTEIKFYKDGVLSSTENDAFSGTAWNSTEGLRLGRAGSGTGLMTNFDRALTDVRVYDRGFSQSDVTLDFSDPWSMFAPPPLPISIIPTLSPNPSFLKPGSYSKFTVNNYTPLDFQLPK